MILNLILGLGGLVLLLNGVRLILRARARAKLRRAWYQAGREAYVAARDGEQTGPRWRIREVSEGRFAVESRYWTEPYEETWAPGAEPFVPELRWSTWHNVIHTSKRAAEEELRKKTHPPVLSTTCYDAKGQEVTCVD